MCSSRRSPSCRGRSASAASSTSARRDTTGHFANASACIRRSRSRADTT
jgi:hypothetical protein